MEKWQIEDKLHRREELLEAIDELIESKRARGEDYKITSEWREKVFNDIHQLKNKLQ